MSAAVYGEDGLDKALSDLLLVELSQQGGIELVERQQLELILDEQALVLLSEDAAQQVRLGRLLSVDVFVWVKLVGGRARMEVVEAATGRGLVVQEFKLGDEGLEPLLPTIAAEAVKAASKGASPLDLDRPTLALAKPLLDAKDGNQERLVEAAVLAVADHLQAEGVSMLHREFVDQIVAEKWMVEKGFTIPTGDELPMLGARFLLATRLSGEDLQLALIETATGRRVGRRSLPLAEAETSAGALATARWVRECVEPGAVAQRPHARPVLAPAADLPLQPETLTLFYRGLLMHNEGRYLDAVHSFRESLRQDLRFFEPLVWIRSSLEASGFDEVAEVFATYIETGRGDYSVGVHNPRAWNAAPGVALVGLTLKPGAPASLRVPLTMLLIDSIHQATGMPVFLTEDMAALRDEYDVLVGLEHVAGTTWQEAPPMLFTDTLTAHVEGEDGRLRLRLCRTQMLDPSRISSLSVSLDEGKWKEQLASALTKLFDKDAADLPPWQPPPLIVAETEAELSQQLAQVWAQNPVPFLKLLALNPERFEYLGGSDWFTNMVMPGIHRWLLRKLPADSPARPMVDFVYVVHRVHMSEGDIDDYAAAFRTLRERYPSHPVGLVARFNLLLCESNQQNTAETEAQLAALLEEFRPFVPDMIPEDVFDKCCDTDRLFRRALGMPGGGEGKLEPSCLIWPSVGEGHSLRFIADCCFPATISYHGQVTNSQHKAMVDLAYCRCVWWHRGDMPVDVVAWVYERFADEPDILAYFTATYAAYLFWNRPLQPDSDDARRAVRLYPVYAGVVVQLLNQDQVPLVYGDVLDLSHLHEQICRAGANDPAFQQARQQVRQAVTDAIEADRIKGFSPPMLLFLMGELWPERAPEALPYLKKWADRSLAGDPFEDQFWRAFVKWDFRRSAREKAELYLPFYQRIKQLHPQPTLDRRTAWLYYDFALVFFQGGMFDLSGPILTDLSERAETDVSRPDDMTLRANVFYLLALVSQRAGRVHEALRMAQRAVEVIEQAKPNQFMDLVTGVDIGGGWQGRGDKDYLNSLVTDLIARLRQDPKAPFRSPFEQFGIR